MPRYPFLRYVRALFAMGRPLFLAGSLPIYMLGVTAAQHFASSSRVPLLIAGLVLVWLVQMMTHYVNEYIDLEPDIATATPARI